MTEHEIIITHILKCKPIDLIVNKPTLTSAQQKQFDVYMRRRALGEPLQYILGSWNFMGLELVVNPSVLVPRPETEQMVEQAISLCHSREGGNPVHVLDLGTGSGCIAIAIAKACPSVQVVSVDISSKALEVAKANAKSHGVDSRIDFVCEDMSVYLNKIGTAPIFDLIISNPPYIPTSQMVQLPKDVQQEPALALDGGVDGLDFYRHIIKYTPHLLRGGACLMMEFGDGQAKAILSLFGKDFKVEILKDLSGRERFLIATRSGDR